MNPGVRNACIAALLLSVFAGSTTSPLLAAQFGKPEETTSPSQPDRKITLNLKETPFRTAIDLLFAGTGLQYAIDPSVANTPVSLQIRDVSVAQAVRLLVRQSSVADKGLRYEVKDNVYIISNPTRAVFVERYGNTAGVPGSPGWLKIELQHVSAAEVGKLLGGEVINASG
jgi:type II secretory pathway component GspD/PulD (secretin)